MSMDVHGLTVEGEVQGLLVPLQDAACIHLGNIWGTMGIKVTFKFYFVYLIFGETYT